MAPATTPPKQPGPPGETPQQRVKRLRAAADAAREAQISTFDKFLVRGRVWADKAHRFTALSLIGITFIAGGVTVYALGDMMIFNRRKRAEFFAQEKFKYESALQQAREAHELGTATEKQLDFLNKEREHQEKLKQWEEERKRKGIWARSKAWLFAGMKKEEGEDFVTSESSLGHESSSERINTVDEGESHIMKASRRKEQVLQYEARKAFEAEKERERNGGPLDRLGTDKERSASEHDDTHKSSWTSWMVR
ncbi:cytochrome oxidase c assembly domain-containing protein [Rutstroemia sp. NJR-2017a BBW]|nr:cytochrome oxidase c assembly domain-containing protein [Rutstroemia sp. NJR-2017a BBW]